VEIIPLKWLLPKTDNFLLETQEMDKP
jgi:hypothetical protein